MYNTHPLISTQEVSISAKNDDIRDRKLPSDAASSQHRGGNERMTSRSDVT